MKKPILLITSIVGIVVCATYFIFCPNFNYLLSKSKPINLVEDNKLVVMSYNIRNDCDHHYKNFEFRAPLIKKNIELANPDIIGLQEVRPHQYKYFDSILKGYGSEVLFREEGIYGEACPLFYNLSVFEKVESDSFYLSETPLVYSIGWGAACPRICSYAVLIEKATNKKIVVANTHLDHVSSEARIKGLEVIFNELNQRELSSLPTIIMGDFNEYYSESLNNNFQNFLHTHFNDSAIVTNSEVKSNPTYNGYDKEADSSRIDYIVGSKESVVFNNFKIYTNLYSIGFTKDQFPSDHYPISSEFTII